MRPLCPEPMTMASYRWGSAVIRAAASLTWDWDRQSAVHREQGESMPGVSQFGSGAEIRSCLIRHGVQLCRKRRFEIAQELGLDIADVLAADAQDTAAC